MLHHNKEIADSQALATGLSCGFNSERLFCRRVNNNKRFSASPHVLKYCLYNIDYRYFYSAIHNFNLFLGIADEESLFVSCDGW